MNFFFCGGALDAITFIVLLCFVLFCFVLFCFVLFCFRNRDLESRTSQSLILVDSVNDPPVPEALNQNCLNGPFASLTIDFVADDPDGTTSTTRITQLPNKGTVSACCMIYCKFMLVSIGRLLRSKKGNNNLFHCKFDNFFYFLYLIFCFSFIGYHHHLPRSPQRLR
jgi:hypothetical protein